MKKCKTCGFEGERYITHFCEGPPPSVSPDGKYIYWNPFSIYPCQVIDLEEVRTRHSGFRFRRSCSSVGRAPHSHCGGQGFEPPQVHQSYVTRITGEDLVRHSESTFPARDALVAQSGVSATLTR